MVWSRHKPAGRVLVDDLCSEAVTGASDRRIDRHQIYTGYYQKLVMERNSDDTEYRTQAFPDVMFESITKFALYTKVLNKLDE